jgi:hypothetical protein
MILTIPTIAVMVVGVFVSGVVEREKTELFPSHRDVKEPHFGSNPGSST